MRTRAAADEFQTRVTATSRTDHGPFPRCFLAHQRLHRRRFRRTGPVAGVEVAESSPGKGGVGVGVVRGAPESLTRKLQALRRDRLTAAALFLTCVFLVLFLWSLLGPQSRYHFVPLMMLLRVVIASTCAMLVMSRLSLKTSQLRASNTRCLAASRSLSSSRNMSSVASS